MRFLALTVLIASPLLAQRPQRLQLPTPAELLLEQQFSSEQQKLALGASSLELVASLQQALAAVRQSAVVSASATEVIREPGRILLRGRVSIVTGGMAIEAEEAEYNTTSGEIQPRGNLRIFRIPL